MFSGKLEQSFNEIFSNDERLKRYEDKRNLPYKIDIELESGTRRVISGRNYENCIRQANLMGKWTLNGSWKE